MGLCSCRPFGVPTLTPFYYQKCPHWAHKCRNLGAREECHMVQWILFFVRSCGWLDTCQTPVGCGGSTGTVCSPCSDSGTVCHDTSLPWSSFKWSTICTTVVLLRVCNTWNRLHSHLTSMGLSCPSPCFFPSSDPQGVPSKADHEHPTSLWPCCHTLMIRPLSKSLRSIILKMYLAFNILTINPEC